MLKDLLSITILNIIFLFRFNVLKKQEDEIRAYNARMKPIWDAEKAVEKAKANRASMLSLAKEAGVKVSINYRMDLYS